MPEVGYEGYSSDDERREHGNDSGEHYLTVDLNRNILDTALTVQSSTILCISFRL